MTVIAVLPRADEDLEGVVTLSAKRDSVTKVDTLSLDVVQCWRVHFPCCFEDVSFGGVYGPCIYRMPGGVVVGDSGLCCCEPVQCV